jgi:hypothetical protein
MLTFDLLQIQSADPPAVQHNGKFPVFLEPTQMKEAAYSLFVRLLILYSLMIS